MMKKLSLVMAAAIFAAAVLVPAVHARAADQNPDLKAKAETFISYLAKWKFSKAEAMMNSQEQQVMTKDKLSKEWHGLLRQWGPYSHHTVPIQTKAQGMDMVYMTLKFQRLDMVGQVYFDQNGDVAGVRFVQKQ